MPNTFEITIKNESSQTRSYILFAEVPAVSTTPGKLFQNAWMTAKPIISKVDGSSQTKFTITDQFYAICGASVEDLEGGVTIATSDYDAVDLGTGDAGSGGTAYEFTTKGAVQFIEPPADTAPAGAFSIHTDDSFRIPDPDHTYVGLGGMNMSGEVVPVISWLAEPSTTYNVFPVIKYYISSGDVVEGEILDFTAIGNTQLIDFTGSTYNSQTFIHNNRDDFVPVPPRKAKTLKLASLAVAKIAKLGLPKAVKVPNGLPIQPSGISEELLAKKVLESLLRWLHSPDTTEK